MRRAAFLLAGTAALVVYGLSSQASRPAYGLAGEAARGHLRAAYALEPLHSAGGRRAFIASLRRRLPVLSGGLVATAREAYLRSRDTVPSSVPAVTSLGCGNRTSGGDIRVNQDCSFRRQTAGAIAANPTDPENLVAGENDSSVGWNHCGYAYSLDGGKSWGSGVPPFFQRGNHPVAGHTLKGGTGTLHTYDAASDPSVAFDSKGNAYLSCVLFDINDPANGILVVRSPAGADGSFYNAIPPYGGRGKDPAMGVVIEDDSADAMADEPKLAADSFPSSPYRDRVYITWTEFIASPLCTQGSVCSSPVYFSSSSNGGATWSEPTEISGNSRLLCSDGNLFDAKRKPHDCDFDQGPYPLVLPNGDLIVLFENANTPGTDVNNQILAVVSKNGGASWSRPSLVGADVVRGEPRCDVGDGNGPEECIPGAFIRATDEPSAAVDASTGTVYAVWNDYGPGRYAVRMSESSNFGRTWTEDVKPLSASGSDSYMASIAVSMGSRHLAVAYYSTARVSGENTHKGLFKVGQPGVGEELTRFNVNVSASVSGPWTLTSVSPQFGAPNGLQTGYNGDYSGIAIAGSAAHPIWSDARNAYSISGSRVRDEDVFTKAVPLS